MYDSVHYLHVTAELPLVGHVLEASKEQPYLSLVLELDPTLVGSVMMEADHVAHTRRAGVKAIDVSLLASNLLDAVVRLVRLIENPSEAHVLAPLVTREIVYRLLMGEQGDRLSYIAALGGFTPHIAKAIKRLHKEFDQPLRVDGMARELGMSVSGFHHHFKAVTAMSPYSIKSDCVKAF